MWEMSGLWQKKALKGVTLLALKLTVRLITYTAMANASAQRKSGAPASSSKVHPLSSILWFALSAMPFCSRVCGTECSNQIPFSAQYDSRVVLMYSLPQSDHRVFK